MEQENKSKLVERLITYLYYLSAFLFFIAFNFQDTKTSGWYQQFLPNLNGSSITDVTFKDSLIGFAVTNVTGGNGYILKTLNGGDNWNIIYTYPNAFYRLQLLSRDTAYVLGLNQLLKTTNAGLNWTIITLPDLYPQDIFALNIDTIWAVNNGSLVGGVFRTTNGGASWDQQFSGGTENPNKIYMYNARIGFIKNNNNSSSLKKTTNGGENWFPTVNEGFYDMYFIDSLTGWKSSGISDSSMKKTSNGGLNWSKQFLPDGGYISNFGGMLRFSNLYHDTIWGVGNYVIYPNSQVRPLLYRTTNGGVNWLYQIPDTSLVHLAAPYHFVKFINKYNGWAYYDDRGIHTVSGGDTTFLSNIKEQITNNISEEFILYQNYPNPFNPISNIKYKIEKTALVKIIVFDIRGKEVATLLDKKQTSGSYEVIFDGSNLSSGIYFYSLFVEGVRIDTKKAVLLK
jgi:photosystem II stability/assembly factor-like uncharacterized protein